VSTSSGMHVLIVLLSGVVHFHVVDFFVDLMRGLLDHGVVCVAQGVVRYAGKVSSRDFRC